MTVAKKTKTGQDAEADGQGRAKAEEDPGKLMRARLVESDLSEAQAKKLGLAALTKAEVAKLGSQDGRPAMRIPYFSPAGEQSDFFRLRYLGDPRGFLAKASRPPRYWQQTGSLNEVYLPPLLKQSWGEVLKDPQTAIYITEGEIKAAVACSKGLPCIGLGGVDVFRASKRGFPELLPVLHEAKWTQRPVAIIWDSDVGQKPDALAAQRRLAFELANRGATPKLLALPSEGAKKVGLDDYLLKHSVADLEALVADAPIYEEAHALWGMNEEVVAILHPPMVIERATGELMRPGDFADFNYRDRRYTARDADGKVKVKPLAKSWLEWPSRFALRKVTFAPGQPQVTDDREWNTWTGWGVESAKGSVQPFLALVDFLFQKAEPGAKDWFLKWAAYPIQHPGAKLFSSAVVWGVTHGTGKTLLGYTLRDIYGANGGVIGDKELHGSFNEWAKNKQFIVGEEITGSDKRADANGLKALITQETINVNAKYLPVITLPDRINYYFTSNEPNALFLQDTDRRFFIHEVEGEPLPFSFYKDFDDWRFRQGGLSHLRHYLEQVELAGFNPKGPAFMTRAKRSMIVDNKSEMAAWAHELREEPKKVLTALGNARAAESCDLFEPSQLFKLFNPLLDGRRGTPNGLGRELKQAGFRQYRREEKVATSLGSKRFWVVRNREKWEQAMPKEAAAHWESFFKGKF